MNRHRRLWMQKKLLLNGLIGVSAVVMVGARVIPGTDQPGPVLTKAVGFVTPSTPVAKAISAVVAAGSDSKSGSESAVESAVKVLAGTVAQLSHPKALETAMR